MNQRPKHPVSVKIALFNEAKDRILLTVTSNGGYGLPGGHIEEHEQPDAALRREMREELSLLPTDYKLVRQHSFWREDLGDRIILGYTGVLNDTATVTADEKEVMSVQWVSHADLKSGKKYFSYDSYLQHLFDELAQRG